jgi:hypothetical protein
MMSTKTSDGQMPSARRPYVRPVLIERGPVTDLTKASNGVAGPDDGGGFPNFYS